VWQEFDGGMGMCGGWVGVVVRSEKSESESERERGIQMSSIA
jgi:hypothetical protein